MLAAVKKVIRRFEAVDFFESTRAGGTIYYNVYSRSEEVTEPDLVGLQAKEEMRLLQERVERKMEAFVERKQTVTSLRVLTYMQGNAGPEPTAEPQVQFHVDEALGGTAVLVLGGQ